MDDKEFQTQVLWELKSIKTDVWELKADVSGLKTDVWELKADVSGLKTDVSSLKSETKGLHQKFDRLDDRLDSVESNLSQEIRLQWSYLSQAFDRMTYIEQGQNQFSKR